MQEETVLIVKQFEHVDLVAARQCGSTSIAMMSPEVPFIEVPADKYMPRRRVVLVLRHPFMRLRAAGRQFESNGSDMCNCAPYLHHFKGVPLEWLPFIRLSSYLEQRHGKELGNVYPDVPTDFPVQPQDLHDELATYVYIMKHNDSLPIQDISKW